MRQFPVSTATPHVLIVDDDADLLETLVSLLESCGYRVSAASTGERAVALATAPEALPDIVLTDIAMPGIDGLEIIHALRSCRRLVPIIAMSGGAPGYDALDMAKKLGADGIIGKPFTMASIVEMLDRHLARLAGI
ncbi:MAG TPA: response regulator [Candidatus Cybelea sp.]|nr:response regulator [Candidatus Cybelea sp.]